MDIERNASRDAERPSPDPSVTEPPARLRFSLRSLLIATLLICVLLAGAHAASSISPSVGSADAVSEQPETACAGSSQLP